MNLQKHINKEENMFSKIEKKIAIIIIVVTILNIFLSVPLNNKVYAAKQSVSGNMTAGASQDENEKYHGGKPGDSTGKEVYIKPWSSKDKWDVVLRYENPNDMELEQNVRNAIASNAILAANNDNIGYDQDKRTTFLTEVSKVGYDLTKLTTKCNTDCSAFVCTIIIIVGYQLNIDTLRMIGITNTGGMEASLTGVGFKAYKDSSYTNSYGKLQKGDILLNTSHHTEIYVGDSQGVNNTKWPSLEIDDTTVNLDDINFNFSGSPQNVTYAGKRNLGEWIFNKIAEFIDYIIFIIINGIKYSILGYAMAFESLVNNAIKAIEGS